MRKSKSSSFRAVNDVLSYSDTERRFVDRLYSNVFDGVVLLMYYMSKTMRAHILDIADAVTALVLYRLYHVRGGENEQHAKQFLYQLKCLRVFVDNLCQCLSIHDLPDEILYKIDATGKPLFDFINKNY